MKRFLAIIISTIMLVSSLSLVACENGNDNGNVVEPEAQEFTVTFDGNGGEQAPQDKTPLVQTVENASELIEPKFEKQGFTFDGWDKELSQITEDTLVTAKWKTGEYVISFDKNGGVWDNGFSDSYTVKVKYGQTVTGLPTLTKPAHKFEKWVIVDESLELNGKDFSPSVEFHYSKDITLKASWVDANSYVITYLNAQTTGLKTSFYEDEQPFKLGRPIKIGYDFAGWTGEGVETPSKDITVNPSTVKSDLTYTAQWTPKKFKVNLVVDGSYYGEPITASYGEKVGELPTPTKTGYDFEGWKYSESLTLVGGDNGEARWNMLVGDIELTAVWKTKQYTVIFSTKFKFSNTLEITCVLMEAGTNKPINTTTQIDYNELLSSLTSKIDVKIDKKYELQEYKFEGWAYKDKDGEYVDVENVKASDEISENGVITLYPRFDSIFSGIY